jgi:hypothetical protein
MEMGRLDGPPADAASFTRSPTFGTREKTKNLLLTHVHQQLPRITVICSFGLINELERLLTEKGYTVSFVPLEDSANFAEFYLRLAK